MTGLRVHHHLLRTSLFLVLSSASRLLLSPQNSPSRTSRAPNSDHFRSASRPSRCKTDRMACGLVSTNLHLHLVTQSKELLHAQTLRHNTCSYRHMQLLPPLDIQNSVKEQPYHYPHQQYYPPSTPARAASPEAIATSSPTLILELPATQYSSPTPSFCFSSASSTGTVAAGRQGGRFSQSASSASSLPSPSPMPSPQIPTYNMQASPPSWHTANAALTPTTPSMPPFVAFETVPQEQEQQSGDGLYQDLPTYRFPPGPPTSVKGVQPNHRFDQSSPTKGVGIQTASLPPHAYHTPPGHIVHQTAAYPPSNQIGSAFDRRLTLPPVQHVSPVPTISFSNTGDASPHGGYDGLGIRQPLTNGPQQNHGLAIGIPDAAPTLIVSAGDSPGPPAYIEDAVFVERPPSSTPKPLHRIPHPHHISPQQEPNSNLLEIRYESPSGLRTSARGYHSDHGSSHANLPYNANPSTFTPASSYTPSKPYFSTLTPPAAHHIARSAPTTPLGRQDARFLSATRGWTTPQPASNPVFENTSPLASVSPALSAGSNLSTFPAPGSYYSGDEQDYYEVSYASGSELNVSTSSSASPYIPYARAPRAFKRTSPYPQDFTYDEERLYMKVPRYSSSGLVHSPALSYEADTQRTKAPRCKIACSSCRKTRLRCECRMSFDDTHWWFPLHISLTPLFVCLQS